MAVIFWCQKWSNEPKILILRTRIFSRQHDCCDSSHDRWSLRPAIMRPGNEAPFSVSEDDSIGYHIFDWVNPKGFVCSRISKFSVCQPEPETCPRARSALTMTLIESVGICRSDFYDRYHFNVCWFEFSAWLKFRYTSLSWLLSSRR